MYIRIECLVPVPGLFDDRKLMMAQILESNKLVGVFINHLWRYGFEYFVQRIGQIEGKKNTRYMRNGVHWMDCRNIGQMDANFWWISCWLCNWFRQKLPCMSMSIMHIEFHFSYLFNTIEQRTRFVWCSKLKNKANDVQWWNVWWSGRWYVIMCHVYSNDGYFIDWIIIINKYSSISANDTLFQ